MLCLLCACCYTARKLVHLKAVRINPSKNGQTSDSIVEKKFDCYPKLSIKVWTFYLMFVLHKFCSCFVCIIMASQTIWHLANISTDNDYYIQYISKLLLLFHIISYSNFYVYICKCASLPSLSLFATTVFGKFHDKFFAIQLIIIINIYHLLRNCASNLYLFTNVNVCACMQ